MNGLLRTVHVLSVALWFGSVAFFTIAGVQIFQAYERESAKKMKAANPEEKREPWFPVPAEYAKETPADSGLPDPLRKEQGSRAAGVAVGAIFPVYFALQAGCGALALLTAMILSLMQGGRLNKARTVVCVLALTAVLGGWELEQRVHDLRVVRSQKTDALLAAASPTTEQVAEVRAARQEFGRWHGISLLVNFATLALTLTATGLAAHFRPSSRDVRFPLAPERRVVGGEEAKSQAVKVGPPSLAVSPLPRDRPNPSPPTSPPE
jgi:hypothetical protein